MANPLSFLLDPVAAEGDRVPQRHRFMGDQRWWMTPLAIGAALLVIGLVAGLADTPRMLFAYLIGWVFCVSISLGALFFVMIQHVTRARWSTTIRRIPEALAASFPILALAGLPILLFGMYDLYHWTHADLYAGGEHPDRLLIGKAGYFFIPFVESSHGGFPWFFVLRYVVYFVAWSWLGSRLWSISVRNDTNPSVENTRKLYRISAYGILIAAVTTAFAGFDWLMSIEPHWFSTMFGIYFFAGGWLGALCLITFIALLFKKAGMLPSVTVEHTQDMGKFMFAFVVFWTYIAFSQYMLYWYANIPEETFWFHKRFTGGWETVSWALLIFNFFLPFLILLPRATKRIAPVLATMAVWLLVMHWVDLWWIAMPSMYVSADAAYSVVASGGGDLLASLQALPAAEAAQEAVYGSAEGMNIKVIEPHLPLLEMAVGLGLFLLYLGATFVRMSRHALTPYSDPYFADSLRFENV